MRHRSKAKRVVRKPDVRQEMLQTGGRLGGGTFRKATLKEVRQAGRDAASNLLKHFPKNGRTA